MEFCFVLKDASGNFITSEIVANSKLTFTGNADTSSTATMVGKEVKLTVMSSGGIRARNKNKITVNNAGVSTDVPNPTSTNMYTGFGYSASDFDVGGINHLVNFKVNGNWVPSHTWTFTIKRFQTVRVQTKPNAVADSEKVFALQMSAVADDDNNVEVWAPNAYYPGQDKDILMCKGGIPMIGSVYFAANFSASITSLQPPAGYEHLTQTVMPTISNVIDVTYQIQKWMQQQETQQEEADSPISELMSVLNAVAMPLMIVAPEIGMAIGALAAITQTTVDVDKKIKNAKSVSDLALFMDVLNDVVMAIPAAGKVAHGVGRAVDTTVTSVSRTSRTAISQMRNVYRKAYPYRRLTQSDLDGGIDLTDFVDTGMYAGEQHGRILHGGMQEYAAQTGIKTRVISEGNNMVAGSIDASSRVNGYIAPQFTGDDIAHDMPINHQAALNTITGNAGIPIEPTLSSTRLPPANDPVNAAEITDRYAYQTALTSTDPAAQYKAGAKAGWFRRLTNQFDRVHGPVNTLVDGSHHFHAMYTEPKVYKMRYAAEDPHPLTALNNVSGVEYGIGDEITLEQTTRVDGDDRGVDLPSDTPIDSKRLDPNRGVAGFVKKLGMTNAGGAVADAIAPKLLEARAVRGGQRTVTLPTYEINASGESVATGPSKDMVVPTTALYAPPTRDAPLVLAPGDYIITPRSMKIEHPEVSQGGHTPTRSEFYAKGVQGGMVEFEMEMPKGIKWSSLESPTPQTFEDPQRWWVGENSKYENGSSNNVSLDDLPEGIRHYNSGHTLLETITDGAGTSRRNLRGWAGKVQSEAGSDVWTAERKDEAFDAGPSDVRFKALQDHLLRRRHTALQPKFGSGKGPGLFDWNSAYKSVWDINPELTGAPTAVIQREDNRTGHHSHHLDKTQRFVEQQPKGIIGIREENFGNTVRSDYRMRWTPDEPFDVDGQNSYVQAMRNRLVNKQPVKVTVQEPMLKKDGSMVTVPLVTTRVGPYELECNNIDKLGYTESVWNDDTKKFEEQPFNQWVQTPGTMSAEETREMWTYGLPAWTTRGQGTCQQVAHDLHNTIMGHDVKGTYMGRIRGSALSKMTALRKLYKMPTLKIDDVFESVTDDGL
jgi:hypothetical protein